MVALGYPSMAGSRRRSGDLDPYTGGLRGLDRRIVDVVARTRGAAAVPPLPRGDGWVLVELVGDDQGQLQARAERLLAEAGALDGRVVGDPVQSLALWKIREDGAGLAGVSLSRPAYPAGRTQPCHQPRWVPTSATSTSCWLITDWRGFRTDTSATAAYVRIDFPLTEPGGRAVPALRRGGCAAGGWLRRIDVGRARRRPRPVGLLGTMYSASALDLFASVKAAFDPDNLLNPGVLVDPRPTDADLRAVALIGRSRFAAAVHKCSGVGKCIADNTPGLGVMCPSYQATREEKDSTRGRARVLQEMINGDVISQGWTSPAVHEASISASPAGGVPGTALPGSTWQPTNRKCLIGHIGAGCVPLPITRWAGYHAGDA